LFFPKQLPDFAIRAKPPAHPRTMADEDYAGPTVAAVLPAAPAAKAAHAASAGRPAAVASASLAAELFRTDHRRGLLSADDAGTRGDGSMDDELRRWYDEEGQFDDDDDEDEEEDDGFGEDGDDDGGEGAAAVGAARAGGAHAGGHGGGRAVAEDADGYDVGGLRARRDVAVSLQASLDVAPGVPVVDPSQAAAVHAAAGGGGGRGAKTHATTGGSGGRHAPSGGGGGVPSLRTVAGQQRQPLDHVLDRFKDRIDLSNMEARAATGTTRHTGRDDRATVEQVLDPRTRMILFKMLASGSIASIHGCVSTGKEANVYHATTPTGGELAVKVYKTSILVFKDRDRYVSGEFRFKAGYARSNPRKMVKLWAEKEMRNLRRLAGAGIRVPVPHALRLHVLTMDFIGSDGVAAPRLKDAGLSASRAAAAYDEVVRIMRTMYQACRLVHADLSEYNM
jgi:serine/threonine-protein kinase RIO1